MFFATVIPSFVIFGSPNSCSMITVFPFGPKVDWTASVNEFTPFNNKERVWSPWVIIFDMLKKNVGLNKFENINGLT